MAHYRLHPPSPYLQIDTLTEHRKIFRTPSNKLNDLCEYYGLGKKIELENSSWFRCKEGVRIDLLKAEKYNKQDVVIVKALYNFLKSWMPTHPKIFPENGSCRYCGSKNVQKRGLYYNAQGKAKQKYSCMSCNKWDTKNI